MSRFYEDLLPEFIAFKSISTDLAYQADCVATADWLVQLFTQHGFAATSWPGTRTNPTVFASYTVDSSLPTILVYGHYDVQPADQTDGWEDDPFVVRETPTHYYARGIVDNKGQVLVHIATVLEHIEAETLGYNVKFLLEGNEESGNDELPVLLKQYKDELVADAVLVSDGQLLGQTPFIERSFRGGGNVRVKLTTAANDLHSGIYGGAVPSAAETLAQLLADLHDGGNLVTVPGFYDGVPEVTEEIRQTHQTILDDATAAAGAGVSQLLSPDSTDFLSQTGLRPALLISGFASGYVGPGFKNIVPASAEVRINVRTVPGQNTAEILELVSAYLKENTPRYATIEIESESHGDPIELTSDHPLFAKVERLLGDTFGTAPLSHYVGGSIPIIADLQHILQKPIISIPLANEDCSMHGVEENFSKEMVANGLAFSRAFWRA